MSIEFLSSEDDTPDSLSVPEGFVPDHAIAVSWVVRKITQARKYAIQVRAWTAVELRRAEREEQFYLQRYDQQIESWCRKELQGSQRKSLSLPGGVIGFRKCPPTLIIQNEETLLKWCKKHFPAAIVTTQYILKRTLKDHIQSNGELPPGAELTVAREKFFIQ